MQLLPLACTEPCGIKTCCDCGQTKTTDQFYGRKASRDGYDVKCRPCRLAYSKTWRQNNPKAVKKNAQRTYRKHHDTNLARIRANHAKRKAAAHAVAIAA